MADKIGTDEYGEILVYQTDEYQCSKSNISEHIKRIFEEGELDRDSVVRKFRTTADDGKTYNVTS